MLSHDSDTTERYTYFSDTLMSNDQVYLYRIKGISPFGIFGPYSNIVEGHGKPDPIQAFPVIKDAFENTEQQFEISWNFNEDFEDRIQAFIVYRSDWNRENYFPISEALPPGARTFVDKNPVDINFYKVIVIDENNYTIPSITVLGQLKDNIPPLPPENLKGTIDSNGIVTFSWDENQEMDLAGYYVFYNTSQGGEYAILTRNGEIERPYYSDTISMKSIIDYIYYKVKAIDFRGNQSEFSLPLKIKVPDIHPPVRALFKKRKALIGAIDLSWTNSSSKDAVNNELQRYYDEKWETIYENREIEKDVSYRDTAVINLVEYQYRIKTTDDDGLISYSDIIKIQSIDDGSRGATLQVKAKYDDKNRVVALSWNTPIGYSIKYYNLYRAEEEGNFRKLSKLSEDQNNLDDRRIISGKRYKYKLIGRTEDEGNIFSNESGWIEIKS